MALSGNVDDLTPAVDLILQPLLLEVLVIIDQGKSLEDALPPDADTAILTAAVQRLTSIDAVRASSEELFGPYELTARGQRLLHVLEKLDSVIAMERGATETDGSARRSTGVVSMSASKKAVDAAR
jgi:hypothetical protein